MRIAAVADLFAEQDFLQAWHDYITEALTTSDQRETMICWISKMVNFCVSIELKDYYD